MTKTGNDARFMALALSLGRRGRGRVWPNPAVGCVIVKNGRIIGRGWTQDGGRPHAEVMALKQARRRIFAENSGQTATQGATAYVTLEPCAHHGQTPPCAQALIDAGVTRVVSALQDPDTRVAGKGHDMLRAAGISVDVGIGKQDATRDHIGFLTRVQQGRPMVTLKMASSFDGRIATSAGESQWITGPPARRMVHAMRMRHDAVLVGGGTARSDDPTLTVRNIGATYQPVRVVCSTGLDIPLSGKLAKSAQEVPLWLCHGDGADGYLQEAWRGMGAQLFACRGGVGGGLDPASILAALGTAGLTRVFCEGGGAFAASLLRAGLVDELIGFTAGVAIGGDGLAALGPMGTTRLAAAPRFELLDVQQVGGDVMHRWARLD